MNWKITAIICTGVISVCGLAGFTVYRLTGKSDVVAEELTGDDKAAYNTLISIGSRIDNPTDLRYISGSIRENIGGFAKIETQGVVYYISSDYENGEYEVTLADDFFVRVYPEVFNETTFDKDTVNKAVWEYYN